ncbi:MAG: hypothetical protein AAFV78_11750, partial [Bacteroidota bacterium]
GKTTAIRVKIMTLSLKGIMVQVKTLVKAKRLAEKIIPLKRSMSSNLCQLDILLGILPSVCTSNCISKSMVMEYAFALQLRLEQVGME